MRILGVLSHHDSSLCLIEDGKIVRYWKEERLARVKREFPPVRSLIEIYNEFGDTIDYVIGEPHDLIEGLLATLFPSVKEIFKIDHHLQHASLAFYNSGFKECLTVVVDRIGPNVQVFLKVKVFINVHIQIILFLFISLMLNLRMVDILIVKVLNLM